MADTEYNSERMKEKILEVLGDGRDSYGLTGVVLSVYSKTKISRSHSFEDLIRWNLDDLVDKGIVIKGKFFDQALTMGASDIGVWDSYRKAP